MFNFTEKSLKWLEEAGWQPERKVDVGEIVYRLQEMGYPMSPEIEGFLQEFSGLNIALLRYNDYRINIDPIQASRYGSDPHPLRKLYEEKISGPSCVLGIVMNPNTEILSMDQAGRVYLNDHEDYFRMVGNTGYHAIENILCGIENTSSELDFEKYIAPWNDDRIREIMSRNTVIALLKYPITREVSRTAKYLSSKYHKIETFLKEKGYTIYVVTPFPA